MLVSFSLIRVDYSKKVRITRRYSHIYMQLRNFMRDVKWIVHDNKAGQNDAAKGNNIRCAGSEMPM